MRNRQIGDFLFGRQLLDFIYGVLDNIIVKRPLKNPSKNGKIET